MGRDSRDRSIAAIFTEQCITVDEEDLGKVKKAVEHSSGKVEVTNQGGEIFGKIVNFDVEERHSGSVTLQADVGWYEGSSIGLTGESQRKLTSEGTNYGVEIHIEENVTVEDDFNDSRTVHSPESERIELIIDEELSTEADKILESRNLTHRRKTELGLVIYSITISNIHHIAVAIILLHWYFIQGDNEPGNRSLLLNSPTVIKLI
jgi:hypothetical protein